MPHPWLLPGRVGVTDADAGLYFGGTRLEDCIDAMKLATLHRAMDQAVINVAALQLPFNGDVAAYFFECAHKTRHVYDEFKLAVRPGPGCQHSVRASGTDSRPPHPRDRSRRKTITLHLTTSVPSLPTRWTIPSFPRVRPFVDHK